MKTLFDFLYTEVGFFISSFLVLGVFLVGGITVQDQMRMSNYQKTLNTVIECRKVSTAPDLNTACGPIPKWEDFKR